MMEKGPFVVNGVGDSKVSVNDLWMCSMSLVDGTRQVFEVVTKTMRIFKSPSVSQ